MFFIHLDGKKDGCKEGGSDVDEKTHSKVKNDDVEDCMPSSSNPKETLSDDEGSSVFSASRSVSLEQREVTDFSKQESQSGSSTKSERVAQCVEASTSKGGGFGPVRKKAKFSKDKRSVKDEWLSVPELGTVFKRDEKQVNKAYFMICHQRIEGNQAHLKRHLQTDYHKSRARSIQSKDISNILNLQEESGSKRKQLSS